MYLISMGICKGHRNICKHNGDSSIVWLYLDNGIALALQFVKKEVHTQKKNQYLNHGYCSIDDYQINIGLASY